MRSVVIGDERGDDDGDLPSLVDAVRSKRPAALDRLVARVQDRVRRWAFRYTGDLDSADDVAQDVLIDLERRLDRFDGRSTFPTWLFSVTRNVALTRRHREAHRASLLAAHDPVDSTVEATTNPDARALAAIALHYFDALPKGQRRVFELADIRGMTPAEIARTLHMEPTTVRAHLFKARRAIRAKLLEHHEKLLKEYRS